MRNWKRIVAALLVLLSLTGMASGAFKDATRISDTYLEAVTAMSDKGVIGGFPNGFFMPKETLTRAQAAKIICTMLDGGDNMDAVTASKYFTDVPSSHWAVTYVGWCAAKNVIGGVGGGKFDPDGQLTGDAFGKMLLVAYGADPAAEGLTGPGWDENTRKLLARYDRDYNLTVSGDPISRQEACQLAYNFTLPAVDTGSYADVTVSLKDEPSSYKVYGRTTSSSVGPSFYWPASGVEFTAELAGEIRLTYVGDEAASVALLVDGQDWNRVQIPAASSFKTVTLGENIRAGVHNIRILKDSDLSVAGAAVTMQSVAFRGVKASVKAPEAKKLFVEFIGDSITSGKGCMTTGKYGGNADLGHSATHAYAYLAAQELDADWQVTSRGGIAYVRTKENGNGSMPKTMAQIYDYVNPFAEDDARVTYDFARKPDVVVIALGTNDVCPSEEFLTAGKAFVKQVQEKYGSTVKLVMICNMMSSVRNADIEKLAKEVGASFLKTTQDNSGGYSSAPPGHPGAKAQAKVAKELANLLKTIV